jgi:putative SOS response-associated peptidase YedK
LIPFWTKRNPDYGSLLRTINARDDSLAANGGMWNSMKKKKRCVVIAQGFYEWLKKNNGKEKIPHFVKRKDGQLMCFAGLWDCVQYEGSEEKIFTYTIITTDPNKQLSFLHDRMPVILENGSDEIRTWLDPQRTEWSEELQALLKPFPGELECYPVSKDVGKVGNNSPDFIVPVASSENKKNIANFFASPKKKSQDTGDAKGIEKEVVEEQVKTAAEEMKPMQYKLADHKDGEPAEDRATDNAPASAEVSESHSQGVKRELENKTADAESPVKRSARRYAESMQVTRSPGKARKTRSATGNNTKAREKPAKASDGTQKITNFFNK